MFFETIWIAGVFFVWALGNVFFFFSNNRTRDEIWRAVKVGGSNWQKGNKRAKLVYSNST